MTRKEAEAFAAEWAAAFNKRDIERVLENYNDKTLFISPKATAVVGVATVRSKQALREYWNKALSRVESLRFAVDRVLWDSVAHELSIVYISEINGKKQWVLENLTFGPKDLIVKTEVFHGVDE